MLYRNIKTGIEFESSSVLSAPNVVRVGAEIPTTKEEPSPAPRPLPEVKEEVKEVVKSEPKAPVKKAAASSSKSKKPIKRTKR